MTRKAVETLLVLVEHSGQVVTKEDLLQSIWPGRVVEDANLTQNIATVRRALSAQKGSAAFIETFPGRGYRLAGPVSVDESLFNVAAENDFPSHTASNAAEALANPLLPSSAEQIRSTFDEQTPSALSNASFTNQTYSKQIPRLLQQWQLWTGLSLVVISLTLGALFWSRRAQETAAAFHITTMTRLAGRETQPTLSPDGKRLAFLWEQDAGQPPQLHVQTGNASATLRVGSTTSHYSSPAWSPDGQALAFLRIGKTATEIVTIALHSDNELGQERLVAKFAPPNYGYQYRTLDWSPDGQWLAVSHSDKPDKPNKLFLVSLATGEKKALTQPEGLVGGDLDPRFATDGLRLSFVRHIHRTHQELFSIPLAGGEATQLTNDAKQISGHAWLGESNQLIFASDRSGEFRLWRLETNGNQAAPQRMEIFSPYPMALSLARHAPLLTYSTEQLARNLWRLDLTTKTWTRVLASSAQDASPQYSPDGQQICFRSDRTGEEQLWVSEANGNRQRQLTQGTLYPSVGHWSPDGKQIVFNNARSGEIFVGKQNESGAWQVSPLGVNGIHPIFSADGQWIYAGSTKNIFKVQSSGGAPIEVVKAGGFSLGLSPSGQTLFFKRDANDSTLWQARTDNGEMTHALEGLLPSCTSCWALTPEGIYYLGSDKDSFDAQAIFFHRYGGTEPDRLIVKYPEPLSPVGSGPFSLTPDFKHLLCVRMNASNSDIMRVEPFP